jgi:TP901 family phage tail tape measure protein
MNSARDALRLMGIVLKDSVTLVGFMNNVMNIFISRFGTMILAFGIWRKTTEAIQAAKEAWLQLDTAIRKVSSIVVSATGDIGLSTEVLARQMIGFSLQFGVTYQQMSDTMFFLASAGLNSIEIYKTFESTMRLVVAASKDLEATAEENKRVVEIMAGLYNVYGDTLSRFNDEQEKTTHIAGVLFQTFKTQQILLSELAVGLSFASSQAKISGISMEELIATIGVMNTNLIKGSKAGTSYANAIRDATRNADKLRKMFDIDITGLGENFSFLESVVEPLARSFEETGLGIKQINELMQIWNVRGLRSIVVQIDKLEEIKKLMADYGHGVENLDEAFEKVTNSYKLQKQLSENIKTILSAMFGIAITGGKGMTRAQIEFNDVLKSAIPTLTLLITGFGYAVFLLNSGVRMLWRIIQSVALLAATVARFLNAVKNAVQGNFDAAREQLKNIGKDFDKLGDNWKGTIEGIKKDSKGIKDVFREVFGDAEKPIEELARSLQSLPSLLKDAALAVSLDAKDAAKSYDAHAKALTGQYILWDKLGKKKIEVATSDVAAVAYIKSIENADEALKVILDGMNTIEIESASFSKTLDKIFSGADPTKYLSEVNKRFAIIEKKNLKERLEYLGRSYAERRQALELNRDDEINGLEAFSDRGLAVWAKYYKDDEVLLTEHLGIQKKESESYIRAETAIIRKGLNDRLDAYREFIKHAGDEMGRFVRTSLTLQDMLFNVGLDDIRVEVDPFIESFGLEKFLPEIERLGPEVMGTINQVAQEGITLLTGKVDELGKAVTQLTRGEEEALRNVLKSRFEPYLKEIEAIYEKQQEFVFNAARFKMKELADFSEGELLAIKAALAQAAAGGVVDTEKLFEGVKDDTREAIKSIFNRMVADIRELGEGPASVMQAVLTAGYDEVFAIIGIHQDELTEKAEQTRLAIRKMSLEMQWWAKISHQTGEILADLTYLIGNEFSDGVQQTIATIEVLADGVSRLAKEFEELKRQMLTFEAFSFLSLGGISSLLGIGAAVIGIARQITSIFRKEEEEQLKPLSDEFLPEDATRRIAPDFGQARVVNQRITLSPIFQFLEASQLSAAQQRNLAFTIFDELQELQQVEG